MADGSSILVAVPADFRFRTTLLSHGWIELAPFWHDEAFSELRRLERLPDGGIVELAFRSGEDGSLRVDVEGLSRLLTEDGRGYVERVVRRIFHLDLDLAPFYDRLRGHERYRWVIEYGGGRLLRAPTLWEDLAKTLLTTNTTWAMTRQMVQRLSEIGDSAGARGHVFPSPEQILDIPFDALAEQVRAGYRNAWLHDLARWVVESREGHGALDRCGQAVGRTVSGNTLAQGIWPICCGYRHEAAGSVRFLGS